MNRRLWWLGIVQGLIGVAVLSVVRFPWTLPSNEVSYVVVLAGIVALQSVVRVDRGSPHRRVFESFWEVPLTIALFSLSPWAVFVGFMVGEIIGCFLLPSMTLVKAFCNLTREFAIGPVLIAAVYWLDPVDVFDQPAAIGVPIAVWVIPDSLRLIAYPISAWARWGEMRWGLASDYLATSPHRLMAALLGYFIVLGVHIGAAVLFGAVVLLAVFVLVVRRATVAHSLRVGFEMIAGFSERTHTAHNPSGVESMLVDAVSNIGSFETYAVAVDDGRGGVHWAGVAQPGIVRRFPTIDLISACGYGRPLRNPAGLGAFGVWPIDERRRSFLVASHPQRQDFRALLSALDYLVNHARLAIASVYDRAELLDIAELEYRRARRDERTELPNRLAAEEFIGALVDRERTLIGVSLLGFTQMVAVLGREVGDQAVAIFAQRLTAIAADEPSIEYIASIGLHEFLVVTTASPLELDNLTRRLAKPARPTPPTAIARSATHDVGSDAVPVESGLGPEPGLGPDADLGPEAAVGVVAPVAGLTADELLRRVDQAVERAVAVGRVVTFGQRDVDDEARRMAIRLRLPAAIGASQVVANFQPQLDLVTGHLAGVEVLARWIDDELGAVSPVEFISIAEQSGQIDALTRSIANQALTACQRWRESGFDVPISINISALSLAHDDLAERIIELVRRHEMPVGLLTIELTESSLVTGSDSRLGALQRLRSCGFKISIDDFGTGYSALSYLDKLPIDEIKIDRSMVSGLSEGDSRLPVLRKLVELCGELGFTVVAEGIETDAERSMLRQIGCDIGQGYLFARPMPAAEMNRWLRDHPAPAIDRIEPGTCRTNNG